MDPSQSFNQPPESCNSSEKSAMLLQPIAKPPVYQDSFAGYLPSFPGQSVVAVQPAVFVPTTPLANPVPLTNPMPEYTCYSIFTLLCCCLPLGTAALVYSLTVSMMHVLPFIYDAFMNTTVITIFCAWYRTWMAKMLHKDYFTWLYN